MRCLHRIAEGGFVYDPQQKRATGIHQAVQSIQKNQLSSKQAQVLIHEKVDRVKMVESFLQKANHKGDFDPEIERKLTQHRLSASFEALTVNTWDYGEDHEEANDLPVESYDEKRLRLKQKRCFSITNTLPTLGNVNIINEFGAPSSTAYYKLSKAEKKQIKRDLLEFAKKSQKNNKESQLRKNLIENEEDLEAKICEGSEASKFLQDHRKKKEKQLGLTTSAANAKNFPSPEMPQQPNQQVVTTSANLIQACSISSEAASSLSLLR